jgi:hypothetical protein
MKYRSTFHTFWYDFYCTQMKPDITVLYGHTILPDVFLCSLCKEFLTQEFNLLNSQSANLNCLRQNLSKMN